MKRIQSIHELLTNWDDPRPNVYVYVVPRIRYSHKRSDYLYQLYRPAFEQPTFQIESLNFWQHGRLLFHTGDETHQPVVHYHWFECQDFRSLSGMIWKWFCLRRFHKRGGKIVWTMHNKVPHNPTFRRINRTVRRWLARKADRIHLHCSSIAEEASALYGLDRSKLYILEHPSFQVRIIPQKEARSQLHRQKKLLFRESDILFLMFGQISHYKNFMPVCEWFSNTDSTNRHLLIAGPVKKGQKRVLEQLQRSAGAGKTIHILPEWISEELMDLLFSACDCVLFNFDEIWMSGAAKMAQSYRKPMILPALGCLPSLAENEDASELHYFSSREQLENSLEHFRRTP